MKTAINRLLLLVPLALLTSWAHADELPYSERKQGRELIQRLAQEPGIDAEWVRAVLADARHQPKIIAAMRRPAEKVLPWHKYRQIFLKQSRIDGGVAFINEQANLFKTVEKKYGVPPSIIAAIIGVETRFGAHIGKDRVLDALATLGFDYPPRAEFFYSELGHFLKLCKSEGLDAHSVVGSYAGAMGMPQFISSSYAAYAVDFNANGKRDLWNEPADIIASVANYFSAHGWRAGEAVTEPALQGPLASAQVQRSTRKTSTTFSQLAAAGIKVKNAPTPDTAVGLVELEGVDGANYWVGYHNFFVITSYNHSSLYAMAVYQLSQAIEASMATGQQTQPEVAHK